MKDFITTEIQRLSHDGRGIAQIDGKTTFVSGALAGESVKLCYTKKRKKFDEARAEQIITPSEQRVKPKCDSFDLCGGCGLQHLTSEDQILNKQAVLLEQLDHFGGIKPKTLLAPLTGPSWGYRRKARLGVKYVIKKQQAMVGFREKYNPRFIADIEQCEILHPSVGMRFRQLKQLIGNLDARENIPQIEVAIGDEHCALIFRHMQPLTPDDQVKLLEFAQQHEFYIYLQPKGPDSIHLLWPELNNSFLSYSLPAFDLHFQFHPADFTQINFEINQSMVSNAVAHLELTQNDYVLDLFCGLGNFSLPIAKNCNRVIGVEGCEKMVQRATDNAKLNTLENVDFYAADLTQPPQTMPWFTEQFTKLLIDPPRTGALEILQALGAKSFERIVYVSCNPATLARDAGELVNQQGYTLTKAGVMDMFPHTSHVESLAVFEKA